ncbi:MAG: DUF167 domain-containing protein [Desulfotalea sp.]
MTDICVSQQDATVRLLVYAQPRASRTKLVGVHDGMLKIACTSPPVDGKANKEIQTYLSRLLGIRKNDVSIKSGQTNRRKQILLTGIDFDQVMSKLDLQPPA